MVVTINKRMSPREVRKTIKDALEENYKKKIDRKNKSIMKLGGLLERLNLQPMEMQEEMRSGWNE